MTYGSWECKDIATIFHRHPTSDETAPFDGTLYQNSGIAQTCYDTISLAEIIG